MAINAKISNYSVRFHRSIQDFDASAWNQIVGKDYPFLRHEFLLALEQTKCTTALSGWQPYHAGVFVDHNGSPTLQAVMPLYLKTNSTGEYVFDWSWADAYYQQGQEYYPKFVTAIPFTPCTGPRICVRDSADIQDITALLCARIPAKARDLNVSSWHILFPDSELSAALRGQGVQQRIGCQYQWFNEGYKDFHHFLEKFSSRKRKNIKKERSKVQTANIEFEIIEGAAIKSEHWQQFYLFYLSTYLIRGRQPYLSRDFFIRIGELIPECLLLIMALKDGKYIAGALCFKGSDTLYGRYWGCSEEFQFLHFETCYYQGIDYCIKHKLKRFDSGAQGEHKIQRGFEPVKTFSNHWIAQPAFDRAINHFLQEEEKYINDYLERAAEYLPFKKDA